MVFYCKNGKKFMISSPKGDIGRTIRVITVICFLKHSAGLTCFEMYNRIYLSLSFYFCMP